MTAWYETAVFYELYVRAFADSNGDGHGDLAGVRQKLDYLQWLGVDCIWLLPICASPLKDDGYDVASYYTIHPQYGLLEDFKLLLDEVHSRGMKLIIDMVMNHTSDRHPWFVESSRSKDSPLRNYYVWSDTPDRYADARVIFTDVETSNWAWHEPSGQYYWHRFYSSQPDLNYDEPRVHDEILAAVRFWLDLGVDGFRLDAIANLYEREGTSCENLPETHAFIKKLRAMVDAHYTEKALLGEVNQWPRDLLPYFGDDGHGGSDELNLCFHFPVMPRLYLALATEDASSVIQILNETPAIPKGAQWATFLRNHDELTLEMVTPDEHRLMWDTYAPEPRQRFGLGIRRRLATILGGDVRRLALMHSLLLTLPGTPVLYYGDEIGMGDNVDLPDRNGVRTPMQWTDGFNSGFSSAAPESLYAPLVDEAGFSWKVVNVDAQMDEAGSLLHTVRNMLSARRTLPALMHGTLEWLPGVQKQVLAFTRVSGENRVLALHNLSSQPQTVTLPDGIFHDVFASAEVSGSCDLAPYAWRWLQMR